MGITEKKHAGMKIFAANPTAYWIMCVALGLFAVVVILRTMKAVPAASNENVLNE
jgi:hypothetical protein